MNLADRAWSLLTRAQEVYADNPKAVHWLGRQRVRFGEPLRLAVVGPPATGKSTLVSAIVGEPVGGAPSGTWRHRKGDRGWPELLVLDVPGADNADSYRLDADAVLHLVRQLPDADLRRSRPLAPLSAPHLAAVHVLAVLARADEVGGGRVDALTPARRLADSWASRPEAAELCQDVVAVAALAAHAARTLRQPEFTALAGLTALPQPELDSLLLSADRFADTAERAALLDRFGLYGVRLAVTLIRSGLDSPWALAAELRRRSGLDAVGEAVSAYFADRAPVLKARSALLGLSVVLRAEPRPAAAPLVAELERTIAGAHEFAELRLLASLRTGRVSLPHGWGDDAARLVGGRGLAPRARLGVDAGEPELRRIAGSALRLWRSHAENPVLGSVERHAAATVARTCEALVTEPLN